MGRRMVRGVIGVALCLFVSALLMHQLCASTTTVPKSAAVPPGMKPVWETRSKVVDYIVTKPVWETKSRVVNYMVTRPVWEKKAIVTLDEEGEIPVDATPEETYKVCKMLTEKRTRTIEYKVCHLVKEKRQEEVEYQVVRFEPTN